jgi:hypothetical protein
MGARPLGRVIQEHVKKPLADQVLFGELVNGGTVTVAVVGEGTEAKLELIAVPPRPAKPKAIAQAQEAQGNRRQAGGREKLRSHAGTMQGRERSRPFSWGRGSTEWDLRARLSPLPARRGASGQRWPSSQRIAG